MRQIKNRIMALISEDGTYTINGTSVNFTDGFQVSFEVVGIDNPASENYLSDKLYNRIVRRLAKELHSKVYLGCFEGSVEVSFHTNDLNLAMKIAKEFNQHSVWDWQAMDIIENSQWDKAKNSIR